eukprot:8504462-Pyramimonas_sp.AAC.1
MASEALSEHMSVKDLCPRASKVLGSSPQAGTQRDGGGGGPWVGRRLTLAQTEHFQKPEAEPSSTCWIGTQRQ